jgi:hypothetical protein
MPSTPKNNEAGAADIRETVKGEAYRGHSPPSQVRVAGADTGQGPETVVGQPLGTEAPPVPGDRDEALVTTLIQGVTALTRGQLEASERECKKSSALSRLSRRQTFLFNALSASDWCGGNPKRT